MENQPIQNMETNPEKPSKKKLIIPAVLLILVILIGGFVFLRWRNDGDQMVKKPKIVKDKTKIIKEVNENNNISENENIGVQPDQTGQLPAFISSVRTYGGGGYDEEQLRTLNDVGYKYVQSLVDFQWPHIESQDDQWKWEVADRQMNLLDASGLKTIPFFMLSKNFTSVPWDMSIERTNPIALREYEELAYEIVNRYKNRPSWSGLIAVWGGSADVWDREYPATNPEVIMPLLNAAYDGIKRADPNSIVIGFNFATTTGASQEDWEEYHRRAFAMNPKFDWYGVQSHAVSPTATLPSHKYAGLQGLVNIRKFLDDNGYASKPLWVNEGGYFYGETELEAEVQAEHIVETYIIGAALPVNLKGWVYFNYFGKEVDGDEGVMAIMTPLSQGSPRPRPAWNAVKTLLKTVGFEQYAFERKISGEVNNSSPFVYEFRRGESGKLWAVFLPRTVPRVKGQAYQNSSSQSVKINIGLEQTAAVYSMYGERTTIQADARGEIQVEATNQPTYIVIGD